MASNENLSQHRFVLNSGSGEIPALGSTGHAGDDFVGNDPQRRVALLG